MGRGETTSEQQPVLLAQRHVEVVADPQDHPAGRLRPPGLDIAEMPGRHVRPAREVELRQVPALPPVPQQLAHVPRRIGHAADRSPPQVQADMTSDVIDGAHRRAV
jgi:hypothetical protein